MARTMSPSRLYTTRSITDRKVLSTNGERLGEIQDIVIDAQRGCIAYAVLTYGGGFLRANRKHFAVPWEAFTIDEAHRDLVLDVESERLRDSPGFDDENWPSEPDESFARDVHSYYGYEYPQGRGEMSGYGQQEGREMRGSTQQEGREMRGSTQPEGRGYGEQRGGYREGEGEGAGLGGLGEGRRNEDVEGEGGSRRW